MTICLLDLQRDLLPLCEMGAGDGGTAVICMMGATFSLIFINLIYFSCIAMSKKRWKKPEIEISDYPLCDLFVS